MSIIFRHLQCNLNKIGMNKLIDTKMKTVVNTEYLFIYLFKHHHVAQ